MALTKRFIANIRGKQGPQGVQGIPGPGAVPGDEAVAAYLATGGTNTQAVADARYAPAVVEAAAADRDRFMRLFQATGTRAGIGRRGTDYDLYQEVASNVWWRMSLDHDTTVNGNHHSMYQSVLGHPVLSMNQDNAAFTYSATSWVTSAVPTAYGGNYARNDLTGATVTFVTPTATKVGIRAFRTTNGGYATVSIDGSLTAATMLPTAQDEVNAGRLAASALTTNGGTLAPTTRLYDSYGPSGDSDMFTLFAVDLSSGAHTVVLTNSGYKRSASTSTRLYIAGAIWGSASITPATTGTDIAPLVICLTNSSVYEYAMTYQREGGTLAPFIGNRHGNEVEDTFGITIDGAVRNVTDGTVVLASSVEVTRITRLLNPDNASETVGNGRLTWTMTAANGLDVHWRINWVQPGYSQTAYVAMLPTQGNSFAKGRAAGGPTVTLLDDDNSVKGSTKSDTLVLWQDGGRGAVMVTVRNVSDAVNRWQDSGTDFAWLQDRTDGDFNKGYFQRAKNPGVNILAGDVWEVYATYRAAWLPSTSLLAN